MPAVRHRGRGRAAPRNTSFLTGEHQFRHRGTDTLSGIASTEALHFSHIVSGSMRFVLVFRFFQLHQNPFPLFNDCIQLLL